MCHNLHAVSISLNIFSTYQNNYHHITILGTKTDGQGVISLAIDSVLVDSTIRFHFESTMTFYNIRVGT